ncbi:MAG: GatB/YqeY domain-containing protein [Candidatus Pacebacteria bacterium]|nr:GatB/YqeY domain-containing protein [Candidatus Paceibacterota bacterium]
MQEQIKAEIKKAMIEKNADRLGVLRMLSASFINEMVSESRIASGKKSDEPLSDEEVLKVIKKEVKKRKDSIEQFTNAGRTELAEAETSEMKVLEEFLPEQMSKEEILKKITEKLATEPVDPAKKGQFVGLMMRELGSNADGNIVKEIIDELVK